MYTFNTITKTDDMLNIENSWSDLHENSIVSSFYNSFPFIYNSLKCFKDGKSHPFITCITFKGELIGIFFLQKTLEKKYFSHLKVIEHSALNEIDKPYPVIHKNFHKVAWAGLFKYLKKEQNWDTLRLIEQLPVNISTINSTIKKLNFYRINPDKSGPIISLDQTWEDFCLSHKKLRKKISTFSRDFNGNYSIRIEYGSNLLSEYKEVESNSWKNGKQGIQRSISTDNFYNNLLKKLNPENVILAILYAEDTPISAELAYIHADTLYLAQGCYNEKYSKYSPGMLSTAFLLRKFMGETSIKNADCLCGYAEYLKGWSDQIITTNRLDVYNFTPRVLYFFTVRFINKIVKYIW